MSSRFERYRDDFAMFILSHGRPNKVYTLDTVLNSGYTGRWYIVVDNEDDSVEQYRDNFGDDKVIVFDKKAIAQTFDTADLSDDRRSIVYARNACFEIAKTLGVEYFVQFDDDYTDIGVRYPKDGKLKQKQVNLDWVCGAMLDFLNNSNSLTVCMTQGGDHFGGLSKNSAYSKGLLRNSQKTYDYLSKVYSGDIYLLCDNKDETLDDYLNNYGDKVVVFDKDEWIDKSDSMDNFMSANTVLYARNAVFSIAKKMGYNYFAMADDDISSIKFRYVDGDVFTSKAVCNFDKLANAVVDFMDKTSTLYCGFGTQSDFIGGENNQRYVAGLSKKVYYFIFCKSDAEHFYKGAMLEDEIHNILSINTGQQNQRITKIDLSIDKVGDGNSGGNSDTYKEYGYYSYTRNFYLIMAFPVAILSVDKKGFHPKISSDNYSPKVLSENKKKV